jgi:putative membrane protein
VSARFLDEEARAAFARAIDAIETASAAEVVVAVRRRSHGYRQVNVAVGALVAFASLAVMMYAEHRFSYASILFDPFVVGLLAGAAVELLPGVKRVLTPPARRREHVRVAARATFVERGVHITRDRTGLLVYISWLEQQVVLVADGALAACLPDDALAAAEAALTAAMPRGGRAVADVLASLAPELARSLPRRADDRNELPDAIDSDLEAR